MTGKEGDGTPPTFEDGTELKQTELGAKLEENSNSTIEIIRRMALARETSDKMRDVLNISKLNQNRNY